MRWLVILLILASSNTFAADCSEFETLARYVATERQAGNRVHVDNPSWMVQEMLNSAFHYPGYTNKSRYGEKMQERTIERFVSDWLVVCKRGDYQ